MAYTRRASRRAPSRSRSTGRAYTGSRRKRSTSRRSGRRMSSSPRTIRIVVQTVAASPVTAETSTVPVRARF